MAMTPRGLLLLLVLASGSVGCQHPSISAVSLAPHYCDHHFAFLYDPCKEPEGIPFYLPKPLLIISKNVRNVEEAKVGLTDGAPIPGYFDDQSKYADLNSRSAFSASEGTGDSATATTSPGTPYTVTPSNVATSSPTRVYTGIAPQVTPTPDQLPKDELVSPETFFTYQIVFVPDLTQKFALKIKGGAGEFRAAMNLVNGWQFTGLGPFYMKDSSTAQNTLAAGIAANLAGRGVADVVKSIADLRKAAGKGEADVDDSRLKPVITKINELNLLPQPICMKGYAEIHIYEPYLSPEGTMEWKPVAEHEFDREIIGLVKRAEIEAAPLGNPPQAQPAKDQKPDTQQPPAPQHNPAPQQPPAPQHNPAEPATPAPPGPETPAPPGPETPAPPGPGVQAPAPTRGGVAASASAPDPGGSAGDGARGNTGSAVGGPALVAPATREGGTTPRATPSSPPARNNPPKPGGGASSVPMRLQGPIGARAPRDGNLARTASATQDPVEMPPVPPPGLPGPFQSSTATGDGFPALIPLLPAEPTFHEKVKMAEQNAVANRIGRLPFQRDRSRSAAAEAAVTGTNPLEQAAALNALGISNPVAPIPGTVRAEAATTLPATAGGNQVQLNQYFGGRTPNTIPKPHLGGLFHRRPREKSQIVERRVLGASSIALPAGNPLPAAASPGPGPVPQLSTTSTSAAPTTTVSPARPPGATPPVSGTPGVNPTEAS